MEQRIDKFLKDKRHDGLIRHITRVSPAGNGKIRINGREYVNFSSNDYLGLATHPDLISAAAEALSHGVGASASRLMTGSTSLHDTLETKIAEFKKKEAALIFNSGYQANVGIISALCRRGDCVFTDRLSHASIIDGIRLSGAGFFRFKHNDTGDLEKLLSQERNKYRSALIVTETVFSMDGDIAPIEKIAELKEKYNCMFMVDEAHATGVFGKDGSGLVSEKNMAGRVDVIMGTFSKALGSFGAYAAMSGILRDYMINTCRSFIYSTALPPSIIRANLAALDAVINEPHRREALLANAGYLRAKLKEKGVRVKGDSQIIPVMIGESKEAVYASEFLKEKGYWVMAIRPPTVPQGQARLRISLTFDHSRKVINKFIDDMGCLAGHRPFLTDGRLTN